MNIETYYVVLDVYPDSSSPNSAEYLGATLECWLCRDLANSSQEVLTYIHDRIAGSWVIAGVEEYLTVDKDYYELHPNMEAKFFLQCQQDGFVAHFNRYPPEIISISSENDIDRPKLSELASEIVQNGAVSLYSEVHEQWANGITPGGEDFVPLWIGTDIHEKWMQDWKGYDKYPVTTSIIVDILPKLHEMNYWVGVGHCNSQIITMHPIALKDAIGELAV